MEQNVKQSQLEQKLLLAKVEDKIDQCLLKNKVMTTSFLDMAQKSLVETYIHKTDKPINFLFTGGYEGAQREILILYPKKYAEYKKKEQIVGEGICVLRITLPRQQEESYTHKQYLRRINEIRY